jgi:hypothetical protein
MTVGRHSVLSFEERNIRCDYLPTLVSLTNKSQVFILSGLETRGKSRVF